MARTQTMQTVKKDEKTPLAGRGGVICSRLTMYLHNQNHEALRKTFAFVGETVEV